MSQGKSRKMLRIISLALVVSIAGGGCSMLPKIEIGMPKMPKLWGKKDQPQQEEMVYEEDLAQPEAEEDRRDDRRQSSRGADTGPATISPYADDQPRTTTRERDQYDEPPARVQPRPTSRVEMDAPRTRAEGPLSAEDIAQMARTSRSVKRRATRSIGDVEATLAKAMRIYTPRGIAPYPTAVVFHGCSGPTATHERDWANFYTAQGMAMIAVDSIGARGLDWEDVCAQDTLNPAERAADVFAALSFARGMEVVNPNKLVISGFAHGGSTVWASLLLASGETPPIGIRSFPRAGLEGVQAAYMFYAPCLAPWTVDVPAISFLGENDKFVDERSCIKHARRISGSEVSFDYEIFKGAGHTFDHRKPNQMNREAGSLYDEKATQAAMEMIKDHLDRYIK